MIQKLIDTMKKYRDITQIIVDVFCIVFAYLLAFSIRIELRFDQYLEGYIPMLLKCLIPVVALNMLNTRWLKIHRTLWSYTSIEEVVRITIAVFVSNFAWFVIVLVVRIPSYIRSIPVIAGMIQLFTMLGIRILYRLYRKSQVTRTAEHRTVILGAGSAGVRVMRELNQRETYNTKVIGFIDNNDQKVGRAINGVPVLGADDDLKAIVEKYNIDSACIAIRNISHNDLRNLIEKCRMCNLQTSVAAIEFHDGVETAASIRSVRIEDLLGRGELSLNSKQIGQYLRGKTVFVTGGGGSIGSEIVRQIMKYTPDKLILMDIYENTMYELQQEIVIGRRQGKYQTDTEIVCLIGSVRDKERVCQILDKYHPDVVYHAAAHKHVPLVEDSPLEALKNNVFGTYNVVTSCIEKKVSKFVLISTDKAVRTTNVMGATKRMCELIVEAFRFNGVTKLCAVRFGNVLGSHGSVIPLFEKQIAAGGPVTVTDPNITRYFMTIPEAAQLVLQAGAYADAGEIFVLDMGEPVKIDDLARKMIQLSGFVPDQDIEIQYTGLRPGEKLYEELLVDLKTSTKTANNLIYIADPENITVEKVESKLSAFREVIKENKADNRAIIDIVNKDTSTEEKNGK